jgi:lysozyme
MSVRKITATAAVAATLAMPITAHHEGLSLKPYYDPAHIKTVCRGETSIEMRTYTEKECDDIFWTRLGFFAMGVELLVKPKMPPEVHAAATDLAYNVGLPTFAKSTMRRKLNAQDWLGACGQIMRYVWVGKKNCTLPQYQSDCGGIPKRRKDVTTLCMKGV